MALTIHSNTNLLQLLNVMNRTNAERDITMVRLATGSRINRASDDPAGLIAASAMEAELASVNSAIENNQRTRSMLDTADGALTEVGRLLGDIERLAIASAGTTISASEKAANQAQVDSAIESIDRIINNSSFNGKKLFGGENQITTTMTAADAADIKDVRVYSRASESSSTTLSVNVTTAATRGTTSGTVVADISAALSADTVISISGKNGTETITLTSGSNLASVVSTINAVKGLTGVSATSSGTQLKLGSLDYGSDAFVSVTALSGDDDVVSTAHVSRETGTDAVVKVNGQAALTSGTEIYYNGGGVSMSATLASNTTGTRTITISGGGATFQLGTSSQTRATIGISGVNSYALGRADLGYLADLRSGGSASLTSDPGAAATIARKARSQVATTAARIGGFSRYQVDATSNAMTAAQEGLTSSISLIRDADMAKESAKLQRQDLLANLAVSLIGMATTQQQQTILGLLR